MNSWEVHSYKEDFPGYPSDGVYLDSATINLLPQVTIDAINDYNSKIGSIPRKILYQRSRKATEVYLDVKELIAKKFDQPPDSFAFGPGLDYSWNQILRSTIDKATKSTVKLKFIVSSFDHNSLLAPLIYYATQNLIEIQFLTNFNLDELTNVIDANTVIAINHVSPVIGYYRDLSALSKLTRDTSSRLFVDFSRSAGQTKINLSEIDVGLIDTSTDLLGPQSLSIIYLSENQIDVLPNAVMGSGSIKSLSQTHVEPLPGIEKFEIGNLNLPAIAGLKASLEYCNHKQREIYQRRKRIIDYALSSIQQVSFLETIDYDEGLNLNRSNIISVSLEKDMAHDTTLMLDEIANIEIRSGRLCSHIGLDYLNYNNVIQISTHIYNDVSDIDKLIKAFDEVNSAF